MGLWMILNCHQKICSAEMRLQAISTPFPYQCSCELVSHVLFFPRARDLTKNVFLRQLLWYLVTVCGGDTTV